MPKSKMSLRGHSDSVLGPVAPARHRPARRPTSRHRRAHCPSSHQAGREHQAGRGGLTRGPPTCPTPGTRQAPSSWASSQEAAWNGNWVSPGTPTPVRWRGPPRGLYLGFNEKQELGCRAVLATGTGRVRGTPCSLCADPGLNTPF